MSAINLALQPGLNVAHLDAPPSHPASATNKVQAVANEAFAFAELPSELQIHALSFFDLRELANFSLSDRSANTFASDFQLWNSIATRINCPIDKSVDSRTQVLNFIASIQRRAQKIHPLPKEIADILRRPTIDQINMIQDWLQARQNLQNWNDVAVKFTREFPLLNFQGPGEIDSLTVTEVIAKGKEYEQHLELFKAKDIIVVWVRIAHAADLQVPHIDELETFTTVEEFINKSTEFAKWFDANREALQGITELDLEYIELISIPNQIWQLTNLQKLNLGENQLTSIPKEIGQLTNLQQLNLGKNQLTSIPKDIGHLTNLQQLFLDKNQLTSIPNEIGHLTNLHNLNLNHNHLISIPNEIGHLTNLQLLELQHNQLRSVPSQIGMLDNLRGLDLENNQLTSFPPEIVMLTNLEALDLSSNQLTDIPFALLLKRINLNITNNPFSPLRRAIFLHTKAVAIAASTVALTLFGLYYNRNWVQDALYSAGNALRSYLPF